MATSFNHWDKIADALPKVLGQVVRKTAFDAQANIQGFIRANGQIDTGFMINSVYTVTSEGSTYGTGKSTVRYSTKTGLATKATRKNVYKATQQELLPEIVEASDETTAWVAVAASYAIFNNYGTRYIPGKPFFEPGIEKTRPEFEAALSAIEPKLKGMIG
jgi:hypothetical protein